MNERQWQRIVLDLAHLCKWQHYHTHDSRRSPSGFPDLVLVRERVVYAELKTDVGRVRSEQRVWIDALVRAGQEVYVWRPREFDEVRAILEAR